VAEDPDKVVRAIGRRIAEVRAERGLTQEQFAEKFGSSLKYVQRVEAGRQNLSVRSLVKLASALRLRTADLFVAPATMRSNPGRPKKRSGEGATRR
jgi:transcriptional regulator with XRE-family HTH domain